MGMLRERSRAAGLDDVTSVEPVSGGLAATAGSARRADGAPSFVKAFDTDAPGDDVFTVEAEGSAALRAAGSETPDVVHAGRDSLVSSALAPRPSTPAFWEDLARSSAHVHTTTRSERFGWHRDGWLGRRRQVNTWTEDGFDFFAQHRSSRWLDEPQVDAALDAADRAALERSCARLPEVSPGGPACSTHGDSWASNVMATADGRPALIDPAVSYTWPEVDSAHPSSRSSTPTGAAADAVRATLAPFRTC
ncbi:hypothetical protein OY671_001988 [Metschnikowia pulcherrima]|nr:hypothetical protein OY671_001988 [Metschnikowia pulcherrima]